MKLKTVLNVLAVLLLVAIFYFRESNIKEELKTEIETGIQEKIAELNLTEETDPEESVNDSVNDANEDQNSTVVNDISNNYYSTNNDNTITYSYDPDLLDESGKILGLNSSVFGSLNGSALTTLNASALLSGRISSLLLSGLYPGITGVGTLSSLSVGNVINLDTLSEAPSNPSAGDLYSDGLNIYYYNGTSWDDLTATSGAPLSSAYTSSYTVFIDKNGKNLNEHVFGGINTLAESVVLNSSTPINVSKGTGKIMFIVNAGSDVSGTITVTGDTVDRNTGAVTSDNSVDLTISTLSSDTSTVSVNGSDIHNCEDGYITPVWFTGNVEITTTDVNLSDVDVYHISYDQFNDHPNVTIQTLDINTKTTNDAAWFEMYLYTVKVANGRVDVVSPVSMDIPVSESMADHFYRLRRGQLGIDIDGRYEGFFMEFFFGPPSSTYFEDFSLILDYDVAAN